MHFGFSWKTESLHASEIAMAFSANKTTHGSRKQFLTIDSQRRPTAML
jgi:hypothetical protein